MLRKYLNHRRDVKATERRIEILSEIISELKHRCEETNDMAEKSYLILLELKFIKDLDFEKDIYRKQTGKYYGD